jgi:hypothetical protein
MEDPPITFTILSGWWYGNTVCPTKSSTKGLGVPQNRRRKVVTLALPPEIDFSKTSTVLNKLSTISNPTHLNLPHLAIIYVNPKT